MLRVAEEFISIDGEVNACGQGAVSYFIRLSGCNLRCPYCDTAWARDPEVGYYASVKELFERVRDSGCWKVTVTGGEPLLQWSYLYPLLEKLTENLEVRVTIETNGTINPGDVFLPIYWVVDCKLDALDKMDRAFFDTLEPRDVVKFVVAKREDFSKAVEVIRDWNLYGLSFAFSPMFQEDRPVVLPGELLKWIVEEKTLTGARTFLSVQLHKLLNLK